MGDVLLIPACQSRDHQQLASYGILTRRVLRSTIETVKDHCDPYVLFSKKHAFQSKRCSTDNYDEIEK